MMKSMVLATNFGKANEMKLCEKEMGFLVRDKDYQTISDRLSEMEPMEASRWLAMQDEHLRFFGSLPDGSGKKLKKSVKVKIRLQKPAI